jgi:site-specific DNA recombinase
MAKCGICGLSFIGTKTARPSGKVDFYYRCNAKHTPRGIFATSGKRCPAKDVSGTFLEEAVWNDIEGFLRNPGEVTEVLRQKISGRADKRLPEFDKRGIELALANKGEERARVLALFRKGRIDEQSLDAQLDEIEAEEKVLRERLAAAGRIEPRPNVEALPNVEVLLERLREKLDAGISWELKRELVEVLVDGITIDTVETVGKKETVVNVRYRFSSVNTCTDTRAFFNCTLERVHRPALRRAA